MSMCLVCKAVEVFYIFLTMTLKPKVNEELTSAALAIHTKDNKDIEDLTFNGFDF